MSPPEIASISFSQGSDPPHLLLTCTLLLLVSQPGFGKDGFKQNKTRTPHVL